MIILGIDTETTGLFVENEPDPEIIEIGLVLFDTELDMVLATFGMIYNTKIESHEDAFKVHKIDRETSLSMSFAEDCLNPYDVVQAYRAKYIVAHNAEHDFPKVTQTWPKFLDKPWLCTKSGINHDKVLPRKVYSTRLAHLCVDYEIQLSGWHRAVVDAEACARIASKHDLDLAYEDKMKTKFRLIIVGPYLKGVDANAQLKESPSVIDSGKKYRWNQDGYPKCWIKEGLLKEEIVADADHIKKFSRGKWKFNLEKMDPPPY